MDTQSFSQPNRNLLGLVIIGGLLYMAGQYIGSQPQRIEQEQQANREITVQGTGEISARPDIAKITVGVSTGPQSSAEVALSQLESRINAVIAEVKNAGVEEEDLKTTNLSVNPQYDFTEGRQVLRGFEASEMVEIKIRDLDSVGSILSRATSQGSNQAGSIQFEIDDPQELRQQAQEEAIAQARANAEELADALGVRLGEVKTFSSETSTPPGPPIFARAELAQDSGGAAAPEVPSGTQEVTSTVHITYEIK